MMGSKISFEGVIRKIIPKLSLSPILSGALGYIKACLQSDVSSEFESRITKHDNFDGQLEVLTLSDQERK